MSPSRSFSPSSLLVLLAALLVAGPLGALAQTSALRMDQVSLLVNAMLDPVVQPNQIASHMHKVVGGSRFKASYEYGDLVGSQCTSAWMQADKSAYWMPSLYSYSSADKTYTSIPATIRFYYFFSPNTNRDPVQPFPKGLRMLIGDPNRKTPTNLATFECQIAQNLQGTIAANSFNFDRDCPFGMKVDLFFPACWNGRDLWTQDMSHMSHPVGGSLRDGSCPISHPIRLPTLQLEYTFHTSRVMSGPLRNNLRWANGDMTGYGVHGDFINGWNTDVLQQAMNNPACMTGRAISMADCPVLAPFYDQAKANACRPETGTLQSSDPNENLDSVPLSALPGCNPDWNQGAKPTNCNPKPISVDGFTGWDGPTTASFEDRRDTRDPVSPGWHNIICGRDTAMNVAFSYNDPQMTATKCQNSCARGGWTYAALGELGAGNWQCQCGNSYKTDTAVQTGLCGKACPGNAAENCGGGAYVFTVYKIGPNTAPRPDPVQADGSTYMGCYQNDQWSTNGLLDKATYTYQSNDGMTNARCRESCARLGNKWAATGSGNRCYCGSEFSYGGTGFVGEGDCNIKCSGNQNEICGEWYRSSVYNISSMTGSATQVVREGGYQGCFAQSNGQVPLNGAQWSRDDMIPMQCINGCSELGFSRAAVRSNTCFCGNTPQVGDKMPDNVCTSPCSGNSTRVCGGSTAIDMYDMTAATITPASLQATKALPNFLGCFVDSGSTNALANAYVYPDDKMDAALCARTCAQFNYNFAGLTNGNTCKCGGAAPTSDRVVPTRYCTSQCSGSNKQTCGGTGFLEAYNIASFVADDPTKYKPEAWVGCYTDSTSGHTLNSMSYTATPMSGKACRTACANQGYTYAATGNGNTCYCGSSLDRGQTAPMARCNRPCAGNANETCGGTETGFIDVYRSAGAAPFSGTPGYQGCFNDDNTLNSFQYSANYMSVEICAAQCAGRGFKVSGMRGGNLCRCGNTVPAYNIASVGCNTPCSANNTQWCGGPSTIAVYDLEKAGRTNAMSNIAFDQSGFGGCYYEGGQRLLKDFFFYDYQLTVAKCISGCKDRGYALAGAEFGTECYCGNAMQWSGGGYALDPGQCSVNCAGGGPGKCGNSYVLSLYSTNTANYGAPLPGPSNAPAPSASAPAPTGSASGSSSSSFSASSSSSTSRPASSSSASSASASASASATSSSAAAPAATTGCFTGGAQSFNAMRITSTVMTVEMCQQWCGSRGFAMAGVTTGNTCGCSGSTLGMAVAAGSNCAARCAGSSRIMCGGTSAWTIDNSVMLESQCKRSEPEGPVLVARDPAPEPEPEPEHEERVFRSSEQVEVRVEVGSDGVYRPRAAGSTRANGTRRWW